MTTWIRRHWKLVPHLIGGVAGLAALPFVHGHLLDLSHAAIALDVVLGAATWAAPANQPAGDGTPTI